MWGKAFLIFNIIFFFDRTKGPNDPPINEPNFEASFNPNNLNITKSTTINKNSTKYLIIFIIFYLKNLLVDFDLKFLIIILLFVTFKILGFKLASNFGGYIGKIIGPFFRSKKKQNLTLKELFQKKMKKKLIQSLKKCGKIMEESYLSICL